MFDLFWDLHQQMGIRRAAGAAEAAGAKASEAASGVREMGALLQKYMLVTEALWSLLREQHGWTDETLAERIKQIDLADGQLDGRVRRAVTPCAACGRPLSPGRRACMYCGVESTAVFGAPAAPGPGRGLRP